MNKIKLGLILILSSIALNISSNTFHYCESVLAGDFLAFGIGMYLLITSKFR